MNWVRLIILLIIVDACMGCASIPTAEQCEATKFPTEEALTECIKNAKDEADRQYEREDRRIREVDKIVGLWNWCKAEDLLVFLNAKNLTRGELMKLQRVKGMITHEKVPKRLRLVHVKCVSELRIVQ